jgi:hypothetical protein
MALSVIRHDAAAAAVACQLRLARRGRTVLQALLGPRPTQPWRHYPLQDAVAEGERWQFYFHAHDPAAAVAEGGGARFPQEHGHVHLFRRDHHGRLSHVAGLSLDARGRPLGWFCTNQWVTGERSLPAPQLTRWLADCALPMRGPVSGFARWLAALVRFYAPVLTDLLQRRDAQLLAHCAATGMSPAQARQDRSVPVWSAASVQWPQDAVGL